ncbi:hypothetical protein TTRE_0000510201 [Trichuris trichiura]|uniref:Uncharacterized protein n=1 Tax=Trichuris trichiura TaxID=36087 RepID=A0A077ZDS5_TRITR|nr:hypothetical protein TTRE_0000510201 [Trichuris trichiura]
MVMLTDLLMPWRLCRRFRDRLLPWSLSDVRCSTRSLFAQSAGNFSPDQLTYDGRIVTADDNTEEELNRMQSSVACMLNRISGSPDDVPSCPEEEFTPPIHGRHVASAAVETSAMVSHRPADAAAVWWPRRFVFFPNCRLRRVSDQQSIATDVSVRPHGPVPQMLRKDGPGKLFDLDERGCAALFVALDERQLPLRCIICRSRIVRLKQQYPRCRIVVHTQIFPPPPLYANNDLEASSTPSSALRYSGYC